MQMDPQNMNNFSHQTAISDWPQADLETVAQCPVCESTKLEILHRGLTDRVFFCAPGAWDLFRCSDCSSAYLDPRPTPASIGRAYSRYFTHGGEWRKGAENLSLPRRVLRALSNGYFNHRFGTQFSPANHAGAWLAAFTPWKRGELESAGRHLPKAKPGQTLLDVGCGNGIFLDFARHAGWQTLGIDFDPNAVACCLQKGLGVKQGGIEILADQSDRFDWITLSHVIEHVHHPLDLLAACHRLLKPGGQLWIETPNLNAQGYHDFGSAWHALDSPRHLVLFTRHSLIKALSAKGFEEITDADFRPIYIDRAPKSRAIAESKDPYQIPASKEFWLHDRLKDWRAWNNPNIRENVTLTARKPA